MYPFVANWFSRCELEMKLLKEANFLKLIMIGGWVLDPATADLIHEKLPNTHLEQVKFFLYFCLVVIIINIIILNLKDLWND